MIQNYVSRECCGRVDIFLTRSLVFVTGQSGAGFHSQGPAIARGGGDIFRAVPAHSPIRGESPLIPLQGPVSHHLILTGARLRTGWGPRQGHGIPKKTPRPGLFSGVGRRTGLRARRFWGPRGPVTNATGVLHPTAGPRSYRIYGFGDCSGGGKRDGGR